MLFIHLNLRHRNQRRRCPRLWPRPCTVTGSVGLVGLQGVAAMVYPCRRNQYHEYYEYYEHYEYYGHYGYYEGVVGSNGVPYGSQQPVIRPQLQTGASSNAQPYCT